LPAGKKLISFATIIKTVYNPNPEQSMKISIRTAMALKTKALAGG
jgi:UDP-N-acetylmuramyl pentapeptide synthase